MTSFRARCQFSAVDDGLEYPCGPLSCDPRKFFVAPVRLRRGLIHVGQVPLLEVDELGDRCEAQLQFDNSRIMFLAELLKYTLNLAINSFDLLLYDIGTLLQVV